VDDYEAGIVPERPWLTQFSDLEDEDYVYMCGHADYVSFYVGHTAGDPTLVAPRYEFLESLREKTHDDATERVARNVRLLVGALDRTGLSLDRDHNFMSRKKLGKIIPAVVFNAHESARRSAASSTPSFGPSSSRTSRHPPRQAPPARRCAPSSHLHPPLRRAVPPRARKAGRRHPVAALRKLASKGGSGTRRMWRKTAIHRRRTRAYPVPARHAERTQERKSPAPAGPLFIAGAR
jgi:hypothetical protein